MPGRSCYLQAGNGITKRISELLRPHYWSREMASEDRQLAALGPGLFGSKYS